MAAMFVADRHLWLSLSAIKEKDKSFLLDAPIAHTGNRNIGLLTPPPLFREFQAIAVSSAFSPNLCLGALTKPISSEEDIQEVHLYLHEIDGALRNSF